MKYIILIFFLAITCISLLGSNCSDSQPIISSHSKSGKSILCLGDGDNEPDHCDEIEAMYFNSNKDKLDGLSEEIRQSVQDSCDEQLVDYNCQLSDFDCQVEGVTLSCAKIFCSMNCPSGNYNNIDRALVRLLGFK